MFAARRFEDGGWEQFRSSAGDDEMERKFL
jgi:hypothetical protein